MIATPIILIVDDDEGHALLIQQALEETGVGHRILRLGDGQAALDFFFDRTASAVQHAAGAYFVLLDIRMPKVNGIEVLRRLKSDPHLKKFPVVMLSTAEDEKEVERCYEIGCSAYVRKPVESQLFADAIRLLGLFSRLLHVPEIGEGHDWFKAQPPRRASIAN